ncbi:uncharacterized protein LOC121246600 [Juglans microcarpa x Juglans regia]|uniref:uncharacterized protein LOC121246600 n=1 Tax=Juglans microcarpa x Juglans regia TaxID=2249226 RepID=UPI001B7DD444|nr:uncharacterized protein LOC121246600 [Juglans microcarpa x Juglans regia]
MFLYLLDQCHHSHHKDIPRKRRNRQANTMIRQPLPPPHSAFQPEWAVSEDVRIKFFKCVRWQLEETMDPIDCPYHYFCDSNYPGNYPPAVDILVFLFTLASYLTTLVIMAMDISRRGQPSLGQSKRYLLPSGPVSLPVILLTLAKGHRIDAVFPLSSIGPAILQLVHISALTFDQGANKDLKYAFFEASTISGILHASLYLDTILLPYYTGFDALVTSTFSGECASCVCRNDVLIVGGLLVSYRGWSLTTFSVVGVLCLRMVCRLCGQKTANIILIRPWLESVAWILILMDSVYLVTNSPPERPTLRVAAFGGIFVLICLHVLKRACTLMIEWNTKWKE